MQPYNLIRTAPTTPLLFTPEYNFENSNHSAIHSVLTQTVDPLKDKVLNECIHFPDLSKLSHHSLGDSVSTADAIEFKVIHYQAALQVLNDLQQSSVDNNEIDTTSLEQFSTLIDKTVNSLQEKQSGNISFDKSSVKHDIGGEHKRGQTLDVFCNFNREQSKLIEMGTKGIYIPENTQYVHIRVALASLIHGRFRSLGLNTKNLSIEALDQRIFDRYVDILQTKDWNLITAQHTLQFSDPRGANQTLQFITTMTPAKKMDAVLRKSYQNDGVNGISSYSIREARHAVNLWRTEFSPILLENLETKHSFSGLRHGVHDAFGIKDSSLRAKANDARVKEFIHASLLDHFSRNRICPSALSQEQVVEFDIVSVNLLTPITKEKPMIEQQQLAFARANGKEVLIQVSDELDREFTVKVIPRFITFNTPVHHLALSKVGSVLGVWRTSDAINKVAIQNLMGMASTCLQTMKDEFADDKRCGTSQKIQLIEKLCAQIQNIYFNKKHHLVGYEPYKLPVRLLALANEIGATPAFNCKSGKDRTGQLNVEIRDLYAHLHATNGQLREADTQREGFAQKNYQTLFFSGGDRKIQALNTGAAGSKSQLPYYNKLMGVTPEIIDDIKGLSKWVGT